MDFRLDDEQVALQDAIRAYCRDRYSFERVASLDDRPLRLDDWQRLHDLDALHVAAGAESGGLGLGVVDTAAVFEVLGEHLVPGPLVWSALAAQYLPGHAGDDGDGGVVGGIALGAAGAHAEAHGSPALVEYGAELTALVVLRDDGVHVVDTTDVSLEPVPPTDPLTPVCVAAQLPTGTPVAGAATAASMRTTGATLSAALLVGLAERALQSSVAYTQQRHQFGRPVGSFQAVQHLLADMYVRVSLARAAAYGAAAIIDGRGTGDPDTAAATAKLLAADAAIRNARSAIQAHGGMGFTWEMIPHYLLKRAWVLEHSFGTRAQHAETVARDLEREVA